MMKITLDEVEEFLRYAKESPVDAKRKEMFMEWSVDSFRVMDVFESTGLLDRLSEIEVELSESAASAMERGMEITMDHVYMLTAASLFATGFSCGCEYWSRKQEALVLASLVGGDRGGE